MKILIRGFEAAVKFYCTCRKCGAEQVEDSSHRITVRDVYMNPSDMAQYLQGMTPYTPDIPVGWSSNGRDSKGQILWCTKCTGG